MTTDNQNPFTDQPSTPVPPNAVDDMQKYLAAIEAKLAQHITKVADYYNGVRVQSDETLTAKVESLRQLLLKPSPQAQPALVTRRRRHWLIGLLIILMNWILGTAVSGGALYGLWYYDVLKISDGLCRLIVNVRAP